MHKMTLPKNYLMKKTFLLKGTIKVPKPVAELEDKVFLIFIKIIIYHNMTILLIHCLQCNLLRDFKSEAKRVNQITIIVVGQRPQERQKKGGQKDSVPPFLKHLHYFFHLQTGEGQGVLLQSL
jgi:hypothetical protein